MACNSHIPPASLENNMIHYTHKDGEKTTVNLMFSDEAYQAVTRDNWRLPKLKDTPSHKMDGDRKIPGVTPFESMKFIQEECARQLAEALVSEVRGAMLKLPESEQVANPVIGNHIVKRGVVMGMWKLLSTLSIASSTFTAEDLNHLEGDVSVMNITITSAEIRQRPNKVHVPVISGRMLESDSGKISNANDRKKMEPYMPKKQELKPQFKKPAPQA